jgi:Uma2 family endonuclease
MNDQKLYKIKEEEEPSMTAEPDLTFGEYTYADYVKFKFDYMVELIRGRIFKMSPAPRIAHQKISTNLTRLIANFLENKTCQVYHAPIDVILPIASKKDYNATTVVQPDLVIICNPAIIQETGCFGVPDFLIEILSPSTAKKDYQNKYDVYEEAGVNEYWIVSPEALTVEIFVLENKKYKRVGTFLDGDIIGSVTLPGLEINVDEIFKS